ncbi:MAG: hypothetical protein RLZZ450_5586 [Pseudomonadota bacterium]|jgi:hypothetical protein
MLLAMAEFTGEQSALLAALAEAWRREQGALERARQARMRAAELLALAHAAAVPPHFVAHAYLRARAGGTTPRELLRAQAALRKRRERTRRRDPVSRERGAAR